MESKDDITFHLGITMAGAVSAGAYSAGFMDYVFEALKLWEAQKKKIKEKHKEGQPLSKYEKAVPLHEVCIDVLGGASAGGMVSVISALSSFSGIEPVRTPCDVPTGNILYDSWVLMDDASNGLNTFEKMLLTDDLEGQSEGTTSLLNTSPIDKIADKVFVADLKRPLPFDDESFDFVACNAVIQHIEPDVVQKVVLPGFARVLGPGGVLQLMFKCGEDVTTVFDKDYGIDRSFRLYQESELVEVLSRLDMTLIQDQDATKLSGLMYFTDPKSVDHCVFYARKSLT